MSCKRNCRKSSDLTHEETASRLAPSIQASTGTSSSRLSVLDGWRALSILLVIAGHWLPIGHASWELNAAVAASGMALFFCLSGFLITKLLHSDPTVRDFLVKRIFRIVPLAWLAMIILIVVNQPNFATSIANLGFYANLPPARLMEGGEHLWSLCVEVQFYLFAALLVALCGRKGLLLLPIAAVGVSALRISDGEIISIVTWHRVDEILAGACVALVWINFPPRENSRIPAWLPPLAILLLMVASLPQAGAFGYFRPYIAALAIGSSLYAFPRMLGKIWTGKAARYIAEISYSLYVWHAMLQATPLGGNEQDTIVKYLLRVPLALATWLLSHLSTRHFEMPLTKLGRRLIRRKVGAAAN
nr:acyltransferase [Qipengyuania sphaerica]